MIENSKLVGSNVVSKPERSLGINTLRIGINGTGQKDKSLRNRSSETVTLHNDADWCTDQLVASSKRSQSIHNGVRRSIRLFQSNMAAIGYKKCNNSQFSSAGKIQYLQCDKWFKNLNRHTKCDRDVSKLRNEEINVDELIDRTFEKLHNDDSRVKSRRERFRCELLTGKKDLHEKVEENDIGVKNIISNTRNFKEIECHEQRSNIDHVDKRVRCKDDMGVTRQVRLSEKLRRELQNLKKENKIYHGQNKKWKLMMKIITILKDIMII